MDSENINICIECIGDEYLKKQIAEQDVSNDNCQCGGSGPTVTIQWLADQVKEALDNHYCYTSPDPDDVPLDMLKEGPWEHGGVALVPLIADMLSADEDPIATKVQEVLEGRFGNREYAETGEEDPWSEEAHYARSHPDGSEYEKAWADLERILRTESRYFNRRAEEVLELVFDDVESLASPFGFTAIETGGPNRVINSVFRGRVALDEQELKKILAYPEQELGVPPKGMALAGRMNAPGISVFYGASLHETVLAEVRPPVGSRAITSRFKFTRDLKFLRITGFKDIWLKGSDFDSAHLRRLRQLGFLLHLSTILTRPVMPGDEASEYLITQAVAEFLSKRFDGLIFSSAQADKGFNMALFGSAAEVVATPPLLQGTKVEVETVIMTNDGPEPYYCVFEKLPEGVAGQPVQAEPKPTKSLRLERNTLKVHHVEAVIYKTEIFSASRDVDSADSCEF